MVAPHGRGDARLLRRRGRGRPPLLALPRRPLRPQAPPPRNGSCMGCLDDRDFTRECHPEALCPGSAPAPAPARQWTCAICSDGTPGWLDQGQARDDIARRLGAGPSPGTVAATNFSFCAGRPACTRDGRPGGGLGWLPLASPIAIRWPAWCAYTAAKDYKIRLLVGARLVTDGFRGGLLSDGRTAWPTVPPADIGQSPRHQGQCHFSFEEVIATASGPDLRRSAA